MTSRSDVYNAACSRWQTVQPLPLISRLSPSDSMYGSPWSERRTCNFPSWTTNHRWKLFPAAAIPNFCSTLMPQSSLCSRQHVLVGFPCPIFDPAQPLIGLPPRPTKFNTALPMLRVNLRVDEKVTFFRNLSLGFRVQRQTGCVLNVRPSY